MNDIIQLLPDSVANQIAAGEVIQRPASVIKELVENAVDAGATEITVLVVDAGRTSIQVIDNGKGMSETDARMAFERHATSKITKAKDLFSLHTMGFRGEALASVAAVAQVELKTRRACDEVGTHLSIAGSKVTSQEPCSCPEGSNFNVENLFFNVPARRKFLKGNSTELKNIITAFERIALVYPDVSFALYSNGAEMFSLKAGALRQRIVDVVGKRFNQYLLPLKFDTTICKLSGFVGKPESARKKNAPQYFFVNGRYMKHPYFHKAVVTAFDRLVPEGEQVPYFIYFDVPAENIDVNIHPTKTEIKFEDEQQIFSMVAAAVRDTVGIFNDVPTFDFDTQERPDIPVFSPDDTITAPKVQYNPTYNPFKDERSNAAAATPFSEPLPPSADDGLLGSSLDDPSLAGSSLAGSSLAGSSLAGSSLAGSSLAESSLRGSSLMGSSMSGSSLTSSSLGSSSLSDGQDEDDQPLAMSALTPDDDMLTPSALHSSVGGDEEMQTSALQTFPLPPATKEDKERQADIFEGESLIEEKSPAHYQYKGKYIMTAVKSGLMIVDQHRAHIRILYEQYLARVESRHAESQKMLFPEALHLMPGDDVVLQKIMPELQAIGFELTSLGGGSYAVNAVPAGLEGVDMVALLTDMLSAAGNQTTSVVDEINRTLALSMARHAALSYGTVLDNTEMENLVNNLFACSNFNYTPDGKTILCILKQKEMEHLLG
mgnify:CR=1 FL=1